MLLPEGISIDGRSGSMSSTTGRYEKRLSDLKSLFQNQNDCDHQVRLNANPIVYEVVEYRKDGSDLFFGTTTMRPGEVAGEFLMTRGHFHKERDMGEVYYIQSGRGILLLESRDGRSETVKMEPGICAFIPPDWAHRSINISNEDLVFVWVCNRNAGHDYGNILNHGMRKIVIRDGDEIAVVENPRSPTIVPGSKG